MPQKKTSSASVSSVRSIERSTTGTPSSLLSSSRIVRRVMPSRMLSVTGGVIAVAVLHEEEVLGGALGDVPVRVQDDGLVEAGPLRVGLRERRVDVGTGDLAARGDHVVVDPAPGGNRGVDAFLVFEVAAVRHRDDRDLGREVVQAHADRLVGVEGERPRVAVLAEELGAQQPDECLGQRCRRCRGASCRAAAPTRGSGGSDRAAGRRRARPRPRSSSRADPAEDAGAVVQRLREQPTCASA